MLTDERKAILTNRVEQAATILDRYDRITSESDPAHKPWTRVRVTGVKVSDPYDCMLGRLFGGYSRGKHAINSVLESCGSETLFVDTQFVCFENEDSFIAKLWATEKRKRVKKKFANG